jgi:hypothetical protein
MDALREAGAGPLRRRTEAALGELRLAEGLLEDQGCWLQRCPHSCRLLEVSFLRSTFIEGLQGVLYYLLCEPVLTLNY